MESKMALTLKPSFWLKANGPFFSGTYNPTRALPDGQGSVVAVVG